MKLCDNKGLVDGGAQAEADAAFDRERRVLLVWCATSYDDGELEEWSGPGNVWPRLVVRHAYVRRLIDDGIEGFGFYPALCMPSSLGDPFWWLCHYPELQHVPRCPYCLAVVEEIARRLVDRLGIVAEPLVVPLSLNERTRLVACSKCGAPAGKPCVGTTGRPWNTESHRVRKDRARLAGHVGGPRSASRKRV